MRFGVCVCVCVCMRPSLASVDPPRVCLFAGRCAAGARRRHRAAARRRRLCRRGPMGPAGPVHPNPLATDYAECCRGRALRRCHSPLSPSARSLTGRLNRRRPPRCASLLRCASRANEWFSSTEWLVSAVGRRRASSRRTQAARHAHQSPLHSDRTVAAAVTALVRADGSTWGSIGVPAAVRQYSKQRQLLTALLCSRSQCTRCCRATRRRRPHCGYVKARKPGGLPTAALDRGSSDSDANLDHTI